MDGRGAVDGAEGETRAGGAGRETKAGRAVEAGGILVASTKDDGVVARNGRLRAVALPASSAPPAMVAPLLLQGERLTPRDLRLAGDPCGTGHSAQRGAAPAAGGAHQPWLR